MHEKTPIRKPSVLEVDRARANCINMLAYAAFIS